MAETKSKLGAASSSSRRMPHKKAARAALPSLDDITPARYARLNSSQRRELTLKLIEFLKSL